MEENKEINPNSEMSENAETDVEKTNKYQCPTAKKLIVCGWIFMIVCFVIAFFLMLMVFENYGRSGPECSYCFIGMTGTFFGGYIMKSLLCGFAVIVESHYRKLL